MRSLFLIFFLAAIGISKAAAAAELEDFGEQPEVTDPKAAKVVAVLKTLDLDHPYLVDTAKYISKNSHDGYVYFMDEDVGIEGIHFQVRYDTGGFKDENMQLNLTAPGSHYNLTGSTDGVMLRYRIEFE